MIRCQILSDLHLEHYGDSKSFVNNLPVAAPNLILAGDVVSFSGYHAKWTKKMLTLFCERWDTVYYIPGNHEFYGTSLEDGMARFKRLKPVKLNYLGGSRAFDLEGLSIWGDTMWFPDLGRQGFPINDFYQISNFGAEYDAAHKAFKAQLRAIKPDIVVTHHLPSFKSVNGRYVGDSTNWCYVADMESYILEHEPKLWVHGHTHDPCDYVLGKTRIVANPSGYPHEPNDKFRADLVVEL